jgi:glutamate synthase (NADPH/NADH) small chain
MDFLNIDRTEQKQVEVSSRVLSHAEFKQEYTENTLKSQSMRCMDCGTPFCHNGCPLNNQIPEWNELTSLGAFEKAWQRLEETNNFPEFTGRVCPAPCENVCTLGINSDSVSIRGIEHSLSTLAEKSGWIKAQKPELTTGKKVAVIGSGPCGLAAAQQLTRAGHEVTVFERNKTLGGLLTYGIPAFKLEKNLIKKRIIQLKEEGVNFVTGFEIGKDKKINELETEFDAILIAVGANKSRTINLNTNLSELKIEPTPNTVVSADDFLKNQIEVILGEADSLIANAKNKDVIVIGGGDTGADCVGTSIRQGANSVTQIEILPKPITPKNSSSHDEGCTRLWSTMSKDLIYNKEGQLTALRTIDVKWKNPKEFDEINTSEKILPADLIIYAIGYDGFDKRLLEGTTYIAKNNFIRTNKNFRLESTKIFAAGDVRTGPSLVVTAIKEGREAANKINAFLT